jgi:DNA mismatch endonuclease Vsr
MTAVRSSGSLIEKKLGKALWKADLRYRKQYAALPGRPDFVLVKHRIAIFCDSHFWHGYMWGKRKLEHKTKKRFWHKKITRNIERDKEINKELKRRGWKVIRFWEHDIKEDVERCVQKVIRAITKP